MKFLVSLLLLGFGAQAAFAYGVAGCGLGSMLISKNSFSSQTIAATTNASSFSQPLGITSGTSNCKAKGWVTIEKEKQYFAELHQEELSVEMANGEGEKLNTLAGMYGCESAEFSRVLQANYANVLPNQKVTPAQMLNNIKSVISKSGLASSCQGS